jgi:hypothetical protein
MQRLGTCHEVHHDGGRTLGGERVHAIDLACNRLRAYWRLAGVGGEGFVHHDLITQQPERVQVARCVVPPGRLHRRDRAKLSIAQLTL